MKKFLIKYKKRIIFTLLFLFLVICILFGVRYERKRVRQLLKETAKKSYDKAYGDATLATTKKDHASEEYTLMRQGYIPLHQSMELSGYALVETQEYTFTKKIGEQRLTISFDLSNRQCQKNDYIFSIKNAIYKLRGKVYIKSNILSQITNDSYKVSKKGNVYIPSKSEDNIYVNHKWTKQKLISHAGGGYRDGDAGYLSYYTNSYDALVQNYNLGARVFEFDFCMTTDGRLAAVHDWDKFANMDGEAVSSAEWANMSANAKPLTDGAYTTMFIEDILDQMMINQDMYLVTDFKFDELNEAEMTLLFHTLMDAVEKRDTTLAHRIIPQIYSEEMYDWIMNIYPFESIIFTCYKTTEDAKDIIQFCSEKENIHVITAKYSDKRFDENIIKRIHRKKLLFYNHTISSYPKLYECFANGVDGVYSNLFLPQDIDVYKKSIDE